MKLSCRALYNIFIFAILVLSGMCLSAFLKNEFFWDFANYHYYNAWAFLNNRLNYDIVPSSFNTFLNPVIELPLYFYIKYFNDNITLIYALQGIWSGLLLFIFYKIYLLFFDIKTIEQKIICILAVCLSITGFSTFHQIGSSTNEIPIAFFILWGLYLLLKMIKLPDTQTLTKFFFAGLIMGIGLGLKQTVIIYCVASGLTLIICYKYLNKPFKSIFSFALGGLIGYLILNGYFMYKYWVLYNNPFFPFLNGFFHSPYFYDFNFRETRFLPQLNTFFIRPFFWNFYGHSISEVEFIDFRLTILYTILLSVLLYALLTNKTKSYFKEKPLQTIFYIFSLLSFLFWSALFSILRYTVILEVLSVIFLVPVIQHFLKTKNIIVAGLFCSLIIVLLFIPTLDKGWDKRLAQDKLFLDIEPINLPNNSLIKLYNFPSAFVIPSLVKNKSIRALGYKHYNCEYNKGYEFVEYGAFRQIRDNIEKNHKGPSVIILFDNTLINQIPIEEEIKLIKSCEQKNTPCPFSLCETWPKTKEMILSIPDNYACRLLKNNIEKRLKICVPQELKTQILGNE